MQSNDPWGRKKFKRKWIAIAVIAVLIVLLSLLKQISYVSEYIFARGFSRAWIFLFGNISSLFPFSVFEVLIVVAVIYVLYSVILWIVCACKKQRKRFLCSFTNLVLIAVSVVLVYTAVASPAYMRESNNTVPLYEGELLQADEIKTLAEWYLDEISTLAAAVPRDSSGSVVRPYNFDGLALVLAKDYERLTGDYLSEYTPRAKPSFLNFMWDAFGVAGVTFAPLGECVSSTRPPIMSQTIATAHELAHTKGIMRENEANLTAYYVRFNSADVFVRYCSMTVHLYTVQNLLDSCPELKDFSQGFNDSLHKGITQDLDEYYGYYYSQQTTWLDKLGIYFNNLYLKISGSGKGTDSYSDHGGDVSYEPVEPTPGEEEEAPRYIPVYREYSNVYKMIIESYRSNN